MNTETLMLRTHAIAGTADVDAAAGDPRMALEIVPIWMGNVLEVTHLVPTRRRRAFVIGEDPAANLQLGPEALGGYDRWTLVMPDGTVRVPPGAADVIVQRACGDRASGPDVEPMTTLAMGDLMGMRLGSVTIAIRAVEAPARLALPLALDWRSLSFTAASLVLNLVILAMAFLFPPDTRVIAPGTDLRESRWIRLLAQTTPVDIEELPAWMRPAEKQEKAEGGDGQRHEGDEGQMGDPRSGKTDRMYSIKGDADPADRRLGRIQRDEVVKTGILSALANLDVPSSPFGSSTPLGSDHENYLGAIMGKAFGPNFGLEGIGMVGTGDGGAGDGEGTIGLGTGVWTKIGHGAYGDPDGVGYCPPGKVCGGPLKEKGSGKVPPKVDIKGEGHVVGCIAKESIRRVIRQHLNEVRFCYEQGLASQPDLEGRVGVGFVIKADGSVGGAKVKQSTIGNQAVEQCIAKAVARWTFPAPEGCGVVIVSYPFSLVPASE